MGITSISRIQHRRGVKADLPTELAEGEFGWCLDTRELFIGNSDGYGDNTQILTQYSNNGQLIDNIFQALSYQPPTSVTRVLQDKLNDITSVKDFGAKGDGITDDSVAINNAISSLLSGVGFVPGTPATPLQQSLRIILRVPAGIYLINNPILLYPNLTLIGDGIGNTIFLCNNSSMQCMMQTVDSLGNTGANIGNNGAELPYRITIQNMSIYTNGNNIDGFHLDRYATFRLLDVEIRGNWISGQGLANPSTAIRLQTIGNAYEGTVGDFQLVGAIIQGFTYGIYSDDPIQFTVISRSKIRSCYRGISLGATPNFNGPLWSSMVQTLLVNIDEYAVYVNNNNPGIISMGNTYLLTNISSGTNSIYWGVPSNNNVSIGDIFLNNPGINNLGSNNLIFDTQQNGFFQEKVRIVTAAGPITILSIDHNIIVNKTVGAATAVALPTAPLTGANYVIKDGKGDASSNNITITPPTGTIDNSANYVISTNYDYVKLLYDGVQWRVV